MCRSSLARSGPTLTQVPLDSLKSSARRPSNISPFDGSRRIAQADGVPHAVEALLVEGGRGARGVAEVPGRHVRSPHAGLELAADAGELQVHAGDREANEAGEGADVPGAHRERRRLGGAEARDPQPFLAGGLDRERLQFIEVALVQSGRRVEEDLEPAEEALAQVRIAAQVGEQRLVGSRAP